MNPERKEKITNVLNRRQPDLTIIMENVHDPHNISAVMRTCDSVGIQEVYVLTTVLSWGKYGKKSSGGASEWLTVHEFDNTEACMQAVKKKYKKIYATHLGSSAHSLYELNLTEPVALVFGNEHLGVTEECLSYCNGNFMIPQVGMAQSLNVSVACAVTLYEAYRQRAALGYYNGEARFPKDTLDILTEDWEFKKMRHKKSRY